LLTETFAGAVRHGADGALRVVARRRRALAAAIAAGRLILSALPGDDSWEALNFAGVEMGLSSRLTDDDISGVLACLDAVRRLKVLNLAGCINLTGQGLEPLRGSDVLEETDLNFVSDHEGYNLTPKPSILLKVIGPILLSIVEREDNSLR
ncbi:hypothetical protein ACHAWF_000440, partial [Thalassiosira exigua]